MQSFVFRSYQPTCCFDQALTLRQLVSWYRPCSWSTTPCRWEGWCFQVSKVVGAPVGGVDSYPTNKQTTRCIWNQLAFSVSCPERIRQMEERSPWQAGSRALVVLAYYFIELCKAGRTGSKQQADTSRNGERRFFWQMTWLGDPGHALEYIHAHWNSDHVRVKKLPNHPSEIFLSIYLTDHRCTFLFGAHLYRFLPQQDISKGSQAEAFWVSFSFASSGMFDSIFASPGGTRWMFQRWWSRLVRSDYAGPLLSERSQWM